MKNCFVEPNIEIAVFAMEDEITASGMRGMGMNPGFDESEPNMVPTTIPALLPPCL